MALKRFLLKSNFDLTHHRSLFSQTKDLYNRTCKQTRTGLTDSCLKKYLESSEIYFILTVNRNARFLRCCSFPNSNHQEFRWILILELDVPVVFSTRALIRFLRRKMRIYF